MVISCLQQSDEHCDSNCSGNTVTQVFTKVMAIFKLKTKICVTFG